MDPPRNIILQSCSTNSLINHKYPPFAIRETTNKNGTPLRHKNYEFYSPSNASPLRFAQSHLPMKNNKNKSNISMNFSSANVEDQNKRFMAFCDFKQNINNNSPKPLISKKMTFNKEKSISQSQNRILTEPRVDQMILIEHEPCNFEDNFKYNSSAKMNFASNAVSLQNSSKTKINRSKVIQDNRMFANIIKKEQKHKRRHSQSSIADSQIQEGMQYLRCKNNDGKKAKYRVVSKQSIEEDLCYCSNCTVSLVQQGFILQKIPQEQTLLKKTQSSKQSLRHLFAQQLQNTQTMLAEVERKQLQTLNQINKFYNQIIDILSQYQLEDIRIAENYFARVFHSIQERKKFLTQQLLGEMLEDQSLNELSSQNSSAQQFNFSLEISTQNTMDFKKTFNKFFRPKIQQPKNVQKQNNNIYSQVDLQNNSFSNLMRFSFQDPHKFNALVKSQKMKNKVQKGKDEGLRLKKNGKNQKKDAFRDLFPQEQSPLVNTEISSPTFKQF